MARRRKEEHVFTDGPMSILPCCCATSVQTMVHSERVLRFSASLAHNGGKALVKFHDLCSLSEK